ncbi:glutaredoxin domain-containing protein [Tissierella praeacuta]|uniref:glutaredoxin domain-containing protein n=1 Tax=Tissierella praeacuta TaxID=43131 RepID=UPI0033429628
MKKIVVFGSKHCPDCGPAKEHLSSQNIKFLYLDISEGMLNLKRFLKYRDNYEEFKEIKAAGNIGIPCIVINDGEQIIFDYNELEI